MEVKIDILNVNLATVSSILNRYITGVTAYKLNIAEN